jgi:ferrous iron transport protein A
MATLDQVRVGQRARVEAVPGSDALAQRLMEMGLLEGEEVEVIGVAPLGDPLELRLCDYRLSVRRSEAARISVTVLPGAVDGASQLG